MITSQAALELILQAKDEASSILGGVGDALGGLGGIAAGVATGGLALAGAAVAGIAAGAGAAALDVWNFSRDSQEALKLFSAQTGITGDDLAGFRDVARDVYAAGLGESIGEVTDVMGEAHTVLGETDEALADATRRALTLASTFELDVAESLGIVSTMMSAGLVESSEEAFDIITTGFQMGINRAGDFQDTLREYSSDFERAGFEADEMLSMLNAGLEEGAYNTDVIADGIREFGIRFAGAEESAGKALDAIGLNSQELFQLYSEGKVTSAEAMEIVSGALGDVDDATLQAQAGAALFGTKWEDVGGQVFLAAGEAIGGIEGIEGATDQAGTTMDTGLGAALERLQRTFQTSFAPLGDEIGRIVDSAGPYLDDLGQWLGEKVPEAIVWLQEKWVELQPTVDWFKEQFGEFSTSVLPRLRRGWDDIREGGEWIANLWERDLGPALAELADALGLDVRHGDSLGGTIGNIAGIIVQVGIVDLIEAIALAMDIMASSARGLTKAVDWVKDRIQDLRDALDGLGGLDLPDWLTPGSPTPFEIGLRGIADAIGGMPDLSFGGMGAGLPALAGAGGGGSVTITIENHYGAGSVRDDRDIEEIARRQQEMLQLRGVRTFEV